MPRPCKPATAFLPAIKALRSDLARFELQVFETRGLIKALAKRAEIADDVEPIERAEAKKRQGERTDKHPGKFPTSVKGRALDKVAKIGVSGGSKKRPPDKTAKPSRAVARSDRPRSTDDKASADELLKVAATIAEAVAQESAALRKKDVEKLKGAVSARFRAERRAGQLLVLLAGRLRPLPPGISKVASKKYRRDAELTEEEAEARLRRAQHIALRRIGAPDAVLDAIGAPPSKPAKDRPSHAAPPHPKMKLTPWTTDATGALSRTLTAEVDGSGAEAT